MELSPERFFRQHGTEWCMVRSWGDEIHPTSEIICYRKSKWQLVVGGRQKDHLENLYKNLDFFFF